MRGISELDENLVEGMAMFCKTTEMADAILSLALFALDAYPAAFQNMCSYWEVHYLAILI